MSEAETLADGSGFAGATPAALNILEAMETLKAALAGVGLQIVAAKEQSGLLGYDGLAKALAIDGVEPSHRQVQRIAKKYRRILRPVPLGPKSKGFRPVNVQKLITHLEETGEL